MIYAYFHFPGYENHQHCTYRSLFYSLGFWHRRPFYFDIWIKWPHQTRYVFLVEAIEKVILIVAIVKREYSLTLPLTVAGLIIAKIYADIVDIKRK